MTFSFQALSWLRRGRPRRPAKIAGSVEVECFGESRPYLRPACSFQTTPCQCLVPTTPWPSSLSRLAAAFEGLQRRPAGSNLKGLTTSDPSLMSSWQLGSPPPWRSPRQQRPRHLSPPRGSNRITLKIPPGPETARRISIV